MGAAQEAANHALTAATRRAKMDAESALRSAKRSFTSRVAGLNKTVRHLERKHNSEIQKLTGVVVRNDIKDAAGRARLRAISKFNKAQMKSAVRDAIHKGEQRALKIEKKMKSINKKTRAALNNRITNEISHLAKNNHAQIDELNLQTASARAEMRKQVLYAIKSAAAIAKQNLKKKVAWAEAQFASLHKGLSAEEKKCGAARAALSASIARNKKHVIDQIGDAVATQQRALLGLKEETAKKIKKTNRNISAHAEQMAKNARIVAAQMKSDTAAINAKLEAARKAAVVELAAVNAASAARYTKVVKTVEAGVSKARKWSNRRFGKVYEKMAKDRSELDHKLAASVANLNDQLAKQSALADSRFSKTVKNIHAARLAAAKDVSDARKYFKTEIVALTAKIKQQETRLHGDIQVVSAEVISDKANQIRINNRVWKERTKIVKIANRRHSSNARARGMLRKLMDQNKAAAGRSCCPCQELLHCPRCCPQQAGWLCALLRQGPHPRHQEAPHHSRQELCCTGAGARWHEEEAHLHQGCLRRPAQSCEGHVQVPREHSRERHHCQRCLRAAWHPPPHQGRPVLEACFRCRPQAHPCAAFCHEGQP